MKKSEEEIIIAHKKVKVTNLDKVYWPDEGYTKGDLINYYRSVAKYILPYLKNRPESLHRFPNGINEGRFYQKNVEAHPDWVETHKVWSESTNEYINFVICNDEATLVYLANLGCIEMNIWSSSLPNLENPSYLVIDLDPEDIDFNYVIEAALTVKEIFDSLGVNSYPKTSGATGMHIFVPLKGKYTYEQVKKFAKIIAIMAHEKLPETTSIERMPEKRQKKVYLDYLQNNMGATMASVYSVRPKPGATVSTPLKWKEVKKGLRPTDFTIKNIGRRLEKLGDIFEPLLKDGIDLGEVLKKLE
jgi:bifunctional non-homologous end joining protein LigD